MTGSLRRPDERFDRRPGRRATIGGSAGRAGRDRAG